MSKVDSSRYEAVPQRTPWQSTRKIASEEAHGFVVEAQREEIGDIEVSISLGRSGELDFRY